MSPAVRTALIVLASVVGLVVLFIAIYTVFFILSEDWKKKAKK